MRCLGALIAALLSSFVLTGPALADDGTVGTGQVITDPSAETEPAPAADDTDDPDVPVADDGEVVVEEPPPPDASGRRGEVHVLDSAAESSAPAAAPAPAATPSAAAAAPARAGRRTGTLPFTGVDAGALLLVGLALLAGGSGLLAVLRQPAE